MSRPPAAVLALALLAACAGGPDRPPPPPQRTHDPLQDPRTLEAMAGSLATRVALPALDPASELPPSILLPKVPAEDFEIARAGDLSIRKSHVCDRFLDSEPGRARDLIDCLVLDALVAQEAIKHGIRVDPARVQTLADAEQKIVADAAKAELGERMSFADYVERTFAMTIAEYRSWLTLKHARALYREYVARYRAMLQDRVQVRCLVCSDKTVAEEATRRARAGADFASLVARWSEDDLRKTGGLLPPFPRGFSHPAQQIAFTLEPGQVSDPIAYERHGAVKFYVVYCLKKLPRREASFADVRAELDRAIDEQPMTRIEFNAFYLELRGGAEKLPSEAGRR